jgi:hypothetical protein
VPITTTSIPCDSTNCVMISSASCQLFEHQRPFQNRRVDRLFGCLRRIGLDRGHDPRGVCGALCAGSMFMPAPSASVFPMERVHARTDRLGLEVFEIARRACLCTPPRRRRSWKTPQLRGASPGTRVEEIATVGAT